MNVLENLFNGEIFPSENICPKNPEYLEKVQKTDEELRAWKNKLNEEDFLRLDDLCGLIAESNCFDMREAFCYGFKLAMNIAFEVIAGKKELVRE